MPRYNQGAIVIQQESPWSQLISGLGQGIARGIERRNEKAASAESMVKELLFSAAANKYPLGLFASKEFEDFASETGIFDHPDIQSLVGRSRETLPRDIIEAPPPEDQGYMQASPRQPGQGAIMGSEATVGTGATAIGPEIPPAIASIPRTQLTPTAKVVWDHLKKVEEDRALKYDDMKRRQQQYYQVENMYISADIQANKIASLPEQIKRSRDTAKKLGFGDDELSYSLDSQGRLMTNFRPTDPDKLVAREDKANEKQLAFERTSSKYGTSRLINTMRLQDILSRDTVSVADLALTADDDPEIAKILVSAAALLSSKAPAKEKVTQVVDRVKTSIEAINKAIYRYNHEIEAIGDKANMPPEVTIDRFLKPITFEEVSGGLTPDQYKAKKNPPSAGKLISEARDMYRPSRIDSAIPASTSTKESDRVSSAYEGIRDVVQAAMGRNTSLTRASIRDNIMGMKQEIMAEYGLNERAFDMLLAMSDRAMA